MAAAGLRPNDRPGYAAPGSSLADRRRGVGSAQPHYLSVETAKPGSVRIGPEVVDHIEADMPIAVHALGGGVVGTLVWAVAATQRVGRRRKQGRSRARGFSDRVTTARATPSDGSAERDRGSRASCGRDRCRKRDLPHLRRAGRAGVDRAGGRTRAGDARGGEARAGADTGRVSSPARLRPLGRGGAAPRVGRAPCVGRRFDRHERARLRRRRHLPGLLKMSGFACSVAALEDLEPGAYAAFAQCYDSRPACQQDGCAESYLRAAPAGRRANVVRQKRAEALAACDRERTRDADFAAFKACVEATVDPCARRDCVERFRARLDVGPFNSSLRVMLETADQACANAQAETAYAAFNACLARSAECDRDACASALPANVRNGAHAADISKALQTGRDSCADARSVAEFNQCFSRGDACERAKCGERLTPRDWSGPHGRDFRTALEGARDACADEGAYADFARCAARTDSCSRPDCAANLPARVRSGPHAGDIADAMNAAQRDCSARQFVERAPVERPTIRPSFDCGRATHNAESAICSDNDLAQLDLELANAFNWRPVGRSAAPTDPVRGPLGRLSQCDLRFALPRDRKALSHADRPIADRRAEGVLRRHEVNRRLRLPPFASVLRASRGVGLSQSKDFRACYWKRRA